MPSENDIKGLRERPRSKNERYTFFTNFMKNELRITVADIKQWTINTVERDVAKVIENVNFEHTLKKMVEKAIGDGIYKAFKLNREGPYEFNQETFRKVIKDVMKEIIGDEVLSRIEISVKNGGKKRELRLQSTRSSNKRNDKT